MVSSSTASPSLAFLDFLVFQFLIMKNLFARKQRTRAVIPPTSIPVIVMRKLIKPVGSAPAFAAL